MQKVMMHNCSVFREKREMMEALERIRQLEKNFEEIGIMHKERRFNYELEDAIELGNMLKIAEVIVYSALQREESRGAHYRNDFPQRDDQGWLKHTLVFQTPRGLVTDYKPVVVTRFKPQARTY
jgi:succinate dehydrogenase / fumarate reductase flavoprotein subunit